MRGRAATMLLIAAGAVIVAGLGIAHELTMAAAAAGSRPGEAGHSIDDPADATGPLDLRSVALRASGGSVTLTATTAGTWALGDLARFPKGQAPYLCLQLRQGGARSRLCLGPHRKAGTVLGLTRRGRRRGTRLLRARLSRPSETSVRVSFHAGGAGLQPGRFAWAVGSQTSGPACSTPGALPCWDRAPGEAFSHLGIEAERPTGCTHHGPSFRTHGPRGRKRIAIGFDDGPSDSTPAVLRILTRFQSHATFFEIGSETSGRGAVMRRILDSGNEIGNHSSHHEGFPSSGSLAATSSAVRRATGFTPCLFRPPGGNVDDALIQRAHAEHMETVTWDVDPRDWSNPGSGAIASGVISHARNGSIVVMHDGGGPRGQTIEALPSILSHFRHRGYHFVTVTELLGNRFTYGG